jgi:hypothetical protein
MLNPPSKPSNGANNSGRLNKETKLHQEETKTSLEKTESGVDSSQKPPQQQVEHLLASSENKSALSEIDKQNNNYLSSDAASTHKLLEKVDSGIGNLHESYSDADLLSKNHLKRDFQLYDIIDFVQKGMNVRVLCWV